MSDTGTQTLKSTENLLNEELPELIDQGNEVGNALKNNNTPLIIGTPPTSRPDLIDQIGIAPTKDASPTSFIMAGIKQMPEDGIAIEDISSKLNITEEEMGAFTKMSDVIDQNNDDHISKEELLNVMAVISNISEDTLPDVNVELRDVIAIELKDLSIEDPDGYIANGIALLETAVLQSRLEANKPAGLSNGVFNPAASGEVVDTPVVTPEEVQTHNVELGAPTSP